MDKMDGMTMNIEQANVEKLKEVFPEVFADGKVDFDKLQGLLGHYIADDKEKYSFSWKGKADSLRLAQKRSTGTLRPCKKESKNWDTTENLYIEGDNLEVLKLLQSSYLNSIKMIYIDPPYNTGNDFVYTDDFADGIAHYKEVTGQATKSNPETAGRYHTNWLNMMYPRLKLARNLLTDDGVIFISIDENEIANLRKICNEVFGEDNFIGTFIWRKKDGGGQAKDYFVIEHEYIVGYRKSDALLWEDEKEIRDINEYKKIDARGRYKITKLAKWGNTARREDRPSMYFPLNAPDGTLAYPIAPDGNDGRWRIGKEKMKELVQNDLIYWEKKNDLWIPYEKEYFTNQSKIIKQRSILYDVANTGDGTDCLTELFGIKDIFENPKPYEIVIKLLKPITTKNDIILDFFSGSATMAHAVMKLNAEDGFNRKYICVQLPEKTEPNSVANKAGYQTICEIGKERIRRAGEKIKDGHSRVDIYLSAIDEIVKNKYIMAQIESYVRDVKDKWIENEDDPEINTDKVIETIKTIINSEDDAIADESTYERGGEKLSDLVMRLAYEVTGLTFGVDIGFKVFKLDSSNLVKWDNTPTTDEEEVKKRIQKSLFYLVDGRSDLDLVYEIMLKYGLSLTLPVEERKFDNVPAYIINHPDYKVLVCLAPNITLSAVEEMDKETIGTYIFADRCFADANILSNTEEILKKKDKEMRLF